MEMLIAVFMAITIALVAHYYIYMRQVSTELRHRFQEWSEENVSVRSIRARNRLMPMLVFLRPIAKLNDIFPVTPFRRQISKKLITANLPLTVNEFLAIKEISGVAAVILYVLALGKIPTFEMGVLLFVIGFVVPDLFLDNYVAKRKREIAKDLPNVIDLLTLCVEAGMDFMLAVKRVVRDYKRCPVTEELMHVWRQIQMGRSRAEALKHLAWRVDMPEVSSFVRALIQGDKMGTPIGEILRIQAEEMRVYRIMRAEAAAMKAPIKMLLPLLIFIMPVILIVVAGPVILKFVRGEIFGGFR